MGQRQPLQLGQASCLAPIGLLLAVILLAEIVRPAAGFLTLPFDARFEVAATCPQAPGTAIVLRGSAASIESFGQDIGGRMRWAAAALVTIALGLGTAGLCAVILARHSKGYSRHAVYGFVGALAIVGIAAFGLEPVGSVAFTVLVVLTAFASLCALLYGCAAGRRDAVVGATFVLIAAILVWAASELPWEEWQKAPSAAESAPGSANVVSGLEETAPEERISRTLALTTPIFDSALLALHQPKSGWIMFDRVVGCISMLVVVLLAFAGCALIANCRRETSPPDEAELREHADTVRLMQFLGAGVLVSGIVFVKTLHDWPLSLVCDTTAGAALTEISNHWMVVIGTYWTLLLVAVFVPVQIALSRSARALARTALRGAKVEPASEKVVSEWLQERGLISSPFKQLMQIVALLSPWLTSVPIATVVELFKSVS